MSHQEVLTLTTRAGYCGKQWPLFNDRVRLPKTTNQHKAKTDSCFHWDSMGLHHYDFFSGTVGCAFTVFSFLYFSKWRGRKGEGTVMRFRLKKVEVHMCLLRQKLTTISVFLLRGTNRQTKLEVCC